MVMALATGWGGACLNETDEVISLSGPLFSSPDWSSLHLPATDSSITFHGFFIPLNGLMKSYYQHFSRGQPLTP